ncbi:methyl-CpG-binding domain protein 1b isoform X1 [Solea solea]|uniref:methyl-CpG-binding domain protein 1b isoform X1 n=1 Tax=Solea solea TaxID=90069 RepID=UPI00272C8B75|nr:methyl-CpG-binding domain protein 1b isoform X1 [Solea solea]XP_058488300.1 methyl-CpG-binding domain protein 1b isoform X1 [Solea solea]
MTEESSVKLIPGSAPVQEDEEEMMINKAAHGSEMAPVLSHSLLTPDVEESQGDAKATAGDPPADWLEPLEDFDDGDDAEEESLAGESERSESVAGSEKAFKKIYPIYAPPRRQSHPDEGWEEWPALGEGWKRKEVIRRSGSSVGQKDIYYLSPRGGRVRSRVELVSVLDGYVDISTFDYRTGKFYDGAVPPARVRNRVKKKMRERSSSESSFMERGEGADTPDSYYKPTPSLGPKTMFSSQSGVSLNNTLGTPKQFSRSDDTSDSKDKIRLPFPSSSKPLRLPSIKGEFGSEESTLVCARCGISFTGTWYDKQRKRPCCPSCWASSKTKEHPMIRFRKWIPCGQCVGCHNTVNCGQCANCKHGLQSPESRKRICRKRKCICPIRKGPGSGGYQQQTSDPDIPDNFDDTSLSLQSEFADAQLPSFKSSDTENFSVNIDVEDDEDMSTDDDDDWHKKRKRRSCGECKACMCRKDCGTCDFCVDKPKFGGSNKKRQKCRLRQCQRQAMRHLLPFQIGQGDCKPEGPSLPGRPRPHYTYSRKSNLKKNKAPQAGLDLTDNEDDDSNFQSMSWSSEPASNSEHNELVTRNHQSPTQPMNNARLGQRNGLDRVPHIGNHKTDQQDQERCDAERSHFGRDGEKHVEEEEEAPMITQVFSLDDATATDGDSENDLMKLLHSLRSSALPTLWYAIMVAGPQLQLIQCSKQSSMTDTMVLIDPGFFYQVTVQKQPLLPTHPLYDNYPPCLTSANEVVTLLLDLEKFVVCHGLSPKDPLPNKDPIILERASTCDFLVKKDVSICSKCRVLQGL